MSTLVAALFVESGGVYSALADVDPWDIYRDARGYRGPSPVVAHPPCKRWGRYHSGGPNAKREYLKGDDDGCFAHAVWCARTFGGVIEHPEASAAWRWFGWPKPPRRGGWVRADDFGGWTCCVEQYRYGHRAQKATWLYAVADELPSLRWGKSPPGTGVRLDEGCRSSAERRGLSERTSSKENLGTPREFAELLVGIARGAA